MPSSADNPSPSRPPNGGIDRLAFVRKAGGGALAVCGAGALAPSSFASRARTRGTTTVTFWWWGQQEAPGLDRFVSDAAKKFHAANSAIQVHAVLQGTE